MSSGSSSLGLATVVVAGVVIIVVGATGGGSSATSLDDASRFAAPMPSAGAPVSPDPVRQDLGPSSIGIPAIGVVGRIGDATLDGGELTPPLDPGVVGAWAGSAALDATVGEVTLAGHVSYGDLGPFVFGRLAELVTGELVYTTDAQDQQTAWRITVVSARPKAQGIDPAAFDGPSGPRELALITCGGVFDAAVHSYEANVYVSATPVPLT